MWRSAHWRPSGRTSASAIAPASVWPPASAPAAPSASAWCWARAAFNKEFGTTFPVVLDDTRSYPVSNAFGLTNVPTVFWIAQDGEIEVSSVGWLKTDFEEINRRMAEAGKAAPALVFKPGEDVRDFRAG